MRARNLKPGLFKNELLGSADPLITILFAGLWCMADKEGRLEDRPLRISAELFPYRRALTEKKVDTMLTWLHTNEFIARYKTPQGRFIQVLKFKRHQNPHVNERPSTIPALTSYEHHASTRAAPDESGKSTERLGLIPDSPIPHSLTPDSQRADSPILDSRQARTRVEPNAVRKLLNAGWTVDAVHEFFVKQKKAITLDEIRAIEARACA